MKTSLLVAIVVAALLGAWKIGYDAGIVEGVKFCPQVQGEKLIYSTQTLHGTECTYVSHGGYGKAKKRRKA